jgi:hypothetical protein
MYKDFLDTDLNGTLNIFKTNVVQMIAMSKFAIPHMSRGDSYALGLSTSTSYTELLTHSGQHHQYHLCRSLSRYEQYDRLCGDQRRHRQFHQSPCVSLHPSRHQSQCGCVCFLPRKKNFLEINKFTEVNHRPGAVYTPIQADTREAKQMEGWGGKTALGRPGQPSEVAPTFVFLASAEASLYCKCPAPR